MSVLERLFRGFPASQTNFYIFWVCCNRCGEIIQGRINLNNDLSLDESGSYYVRKVLMGSERCFERLEVVLQFDAARKLQSKHVNGGTFVEAPPTRG